MCFLPQSNRNKDRDSQHWKLKEWVSSGFYPDKATVLQTNCSPWAVGEVGFKRR